MSLKGKSITGRLFASVEAFTDTGVAGVGRRVREVIEACYFKSGLHSTKKVGGGGGCVMYAGDIPSSKQRKALDLTSFKKNGETRDQKKDPSQSDHGSIRSAKGVRLLIPGGNAKTLPKGRR